MQLDIALTPTLYVQHPMRRRPHTAVVVDVLRATTTICAAFQAGAREVVPLNSLESLADFERDGFITAAERGGRKVGNATLGNSPTEYMQLDLAGARIAFSSTNGTVALFDAAGADRVLIGCFANLGALVQRLLHQSHDVVVVCSGWQLDFSLEDTLFAGALAQRLLDSGSYAAHSDSVSMALELYRVAADNLYDYCLRGTHIQRLQGMNYDADVRFALRPDTCPLVPELRDGRITCQQ